MKKVKIKFWGLCGILIGSIIVAEILSENFWALHYGKDDGLVFRILMFSITCSWFMYKVWSKKILIPIGFIVGIISHVIVYILYTLLSRFGFNNIVGSIPVIGDQIISVIMIIAVVLFLKKKKE